MSELRYHKPCAVCNCGLDIVLDTDDQSISITSPEVTPLVRDKQKIVDAYRRVKKLPLSWESAHKARAIIVAGDIISAFPPMPQIAENAVLMLDWMALKNTKWDLGDVAAKIPQFLEYQRALKESVKRPRCGICWENFDGVGDRCKRHEGF